MYWTKCKLRFFSNLIESKFETIKDQALTSLIYCIFSRAVIGLFISFGLYVLQQYYHYRSYKNRLIDKLLAIRKHIEDTKKTPEAATCHKWFYELAEEDLVSILNAGEYEEVANTHDQIK